MEHLQETYVFSMKYDKLVDDLGVSRKMSREQIQWTIRTYGDGSILMGSYGTILGTQSTDIDSDIYMATAENEDGGMCQRELGDEQHQLLRVQKPPWFFDPDPIAKLEKPGE